MKEIKLAVVGCSGVGKSATTTQFVQNFFVEESDCTLEEKYRKQVILEGEDCILEITDTAGTNRFTSYRDQMYKMQHGFILMYSTISRRSFEAVDSYRDAVLQVRANEVVPMVLVGNMSDIKSLREVSAKEGQDLADLWGIPFLENSAKNLEDCSEVFKRLAGRTLLHEIPMEIGKLQKQAQEIRWWKLKKKSQVRRSIKELKTQQNEREAKFQLEIFQAELAKTTIDALPDLKIEHSSLAHDMQKLWLDRDTADVTLTVGSLPFYCHMAVLHLRAPAIFRHIPPMCKNYNVPPKLCNNSVVFSVVLRHVYTGEIPGNLHADLIQLVKMAANSFELPELVAQVESQSFVPAPVSWNLSALLKTHHSGANITAKCGAKVFTLHRCVMQTRLPHYCQIFGNGPVINVEDIEPHIFAILIEYIYNDDVTTRLATGTLVDVIRVSARFHLPRLSQICESKLAKGLNDGSFHEISENILDTYEAGMTNVSPEFRIFTEISAVCPEVWHLLTSNYRYRQVVPHNQRAALGVRHEMMTSHLQRKSHLEKQIALCISKIE